MCPSLYLIFHQPNSNKSGVISCFNLILHIATRCSSVNVFGVKFTMKIYYSKRSNMKEIFVKFENM